MNAPSLERKSIVKSYFSMKKHNAIVAWKKAKVMKRCYLFLLPYAIIFTAFNIVPLITSIYYSFTYYNILEPAKFNGVQNYINLFLQDDVFLIGIKNTFLIAAITGPVGYILSFVIAWFINELPSWLRAIAVVFFYAPSIAGNIYYIFSIFFRGDTYGIVNGFLIKLGIIQDPIMFLTNPEYMMPIIILVILWMSLGQGFLAFVAGLQGIDRSQYEAGMIDGVKNRWQELWYITLPNMKPMLLFGAVMAITSSFGVCNQTMALCGYPSTDYAARTVVTHLFDYGFSRFEMGYASAIATFLFVVMILCNKAIQSLLRRVGT
ncbi:MAG: sugar ABC transporter permease [Lachnospiraceae bacterium]|nr:sugar ABC transporter permease [Lachnospiraceae bacterium]